jgi:hypothetical protein
MIPAPTDKSGPVVWVACDREGTCEAVCSTLERAMFVAQDNNLVPRKYQDDDGSLPVYGWEPCTWSPVAQDGCPNISMVVWELRASERPDVIAATVRAHRIDEYLPAEAIYD